MLFAKMWMNLKIIILHAIKDRHMILYVEYKKLTN